MAAKETVSECQRNDAPVYVALFAHCLIVTVAEYGESSGFATTSHECDSFIAK